MLKLWGATTGWIYRYRLGQIRDRTSLGDPFSELESWEEDGLLTDFED